MAALERLYNRVELTSIGGPIVIPMPAEAAEHVKVTLR